MARDFNGTTDRIDYASVYAPGATAITCAGWVFPDNITNEQRFVAIHDAGDAQNELGASLDPFTGNGGAAYLLDWTTGLSFRERFGAGAFVTGAWQHFIIQSTDGSGTNAECWIDGVIPGSTSVGNGSGAPRNTAGSWSLGGRIPDNNVNLNGRLAEVGVWDRILAAGERDALASAFSPLFFRRGLRYYTKLHEPSIDVVAGRTPTFDGTTVIDHPRIFYPN